MNVGDRVMALVLEHPGAGTCLVPGVVTYVGRNIFTVETEHHGVKDYSLRGSKDYILPANPVTDPIERDAVWRRIEDRIKQRRQLNS